MVGLDMINSDMTGSGRTDLDMINSDLSDRKRQVDRNLLVFTSKFLVFTDLTWYLLVFTDLIYQYLLGIYLVLVFTDLTC